MSPLEVERNGSEQSSIEAQRIRVAEYTEDMGVAHTAARMEQGGIQGAKRLMIGLPVTTAYQARAAEASARLGLDYNVLDAMG